MATVINVVWRSRCGTIRIVHQQGVWCLEHWVLVLPEKVWLWRQISLHEDLQAARDAAESLSLDIAAAQLRLSG